MAHQQQEVAKMSCNQLKIQQSFHDLSLLDSSYQTANEEDNDRDCNQNGGGAGSLPGWPAKIKSQRLIDSNNEESTTDEDELGGDKSASCTYQKVAGAYNPSQSERRPSTEASSEQLWLDRKRSTWRQQSLMARRPAAGPNRLIDAAAECEARAANDDAEGQTFVAKESGPPMWQLANAGPAEDGLEPPLSSLFDLNCSAKTTTGDSLFEKQHNTSAGRESIMIRVEQYSPTSNEFRTVELGESGESAAVQSIRQQNSTLNNLMSFHHLKSQVASHPELASGGVVVPSRSCSALDLTSFGTADHGCNVAAQAVEMATSVAPANQDRRATRGAEVDEVSGTQTIRFTKLLSPPNSCLASGGSLSDHSSQIQSIGRLLANDAVGRQRIESRLRGWKRANKIITNIHENPFNAHLNLLERFEDRMGAEENLSATRAASDCNGRAQQQESAGPIAGDAMQPDVAETKPTTTTGGANATGGPPKQDQLTSCALHLTHLYRKNQTLMDNNSEFRALLYNIICCLLVQDEQVLASQSVGKMLEVIRAHLDSVTLAYTMVSGAAEGHRAAPPPNQEIKKLPVAPQNVHSERTEEATSRDCSAGGVAALPGGAVRRGQKAFDFRRISSVSFNDEQLINDLCGERAREASRRSGSLSVEKLNDGRDSPWAYQELSAERRRPRLDSSSTASQQQLETTTSQSSLDQTNEAGQRLKQQLTSENTNDSGNGTMCDCPTTTTSSSSEKQRRALSIPSVRAAESTSDGRRIDGSARKFSATASELLSCQPMRFESEFRPKQQPSYMSTDDYMTSANNNNNNDNWTSTTLAVENTDCDADGLTSSATGGASIAGGRTGAGFASAANCTDAASRRAELEWTLNKLINLELKHTWLTSNETLKRAIRKIGVPNEIRAKVWLILIGQLVGDKYAVGDFLAQANKTIARQMGGAQEAHDAESEPDEELQAILKQIELDINRTMPGHRLFEDGAEGGTKLRRILVAYSVHINREIAYCQGFNFIVALLLSLFDGDEEKALRGFVCIVDHIFPSKYYFDHYLTGARADQFLLADFICDQLIKNPTMAERKMVEGVTSSITLNWFISLFHGAVPTQTRLTILDHFMLEGVKALFRFTMAILYLAFQVAPPSSCEVFTAIRNTAKDLYDVKLLLSIVDQIKLPKDSYFAIRRSFYMVQSSLNSDQFYMQTLSNDAKRNLNPNKPLSVQQLPDTKRPALSLITNASPLSQHHAASAPFFGFNGHQDHSSGSANYNFTIRNSICTDSSLTGCSPRVRTSANQTKVCIQSLGKLGRSHIKIIDANVKTNERSLMSPLRNCIVIGISNCGKNLIVARQSSRRSFKSFREQDLTFHIHEICTEIFDGFYLEEANLALIVTHQGEVFRIDTTRCFTDNQEGSTETLMLRESHPMADHERVKLRLASLDELTNLLWIYVECEDTSPLSAASNRCPWSPSNATIGQQKLQQAGSALSSINVGPKPKFRNNNPFLSIADEEPDSSSAEQQPKTSDTSLHQPSRQTFHRKIILIDIITFDLFSAFAMNPNFGEIISMRTSLVAFCQLTNHMSSQFSSKIIQIGPTGRYEQLLSFSDVVDYRVSVADSWRQKFNPSKAKTEDTFARDKKYSSQRYSSFRGFLRRSGSLNNNTAGTSAEQSDSLGDQPVNSSGTLTRYYHSLIRSQSTASNGTNGSGSMSTLRKQENTADELGCLREEGNSAKGKPACMVRDDALHSMVASGLGDFSGLSETNYIPVNMAFIFRNGKIALFEFTESYAIHTREAQLDRYDYSRVIDVTKDGNVFIVTILTIFDKLIKVVI